MLASILLSRKNKEEQNSLVFFIWGGIIEHILVTGFHSLLKKNPKDNLCCQKGTLPKFGCVLSHTWL